MSNCKHKRWVPGHFKNDFSGEQAWVTGIMVDALEMVTIISAESLTPIQCDVCEICGGHFPLRAISANDIRSRTDGTRLVSVIK